MSSNESLSPKESNEGNCAPKQTLMASLVSYSSDTGSDSESSVSKTVSQNFISISNHSKNSVCEKPNSKESCELLVKSSSYASENLSSSLSPQNFRLSRHKEDFVLKSGENEENESSVPLIESPRNKIGNALKTFATPTSVNKSEMFRRTSSTPLKRSFSLTENDCIEDAASYTPRKSFKRKQENENNWESPHRYQSSRKSLPAVIQPTYTSSIENKRQSFPFTKFQNHSPTSNRNFYRCRTDQTPFSPAPKRRRFNLPYYDAFSLMSLESEFGFIDSHCHLDFLFQRQNYQGTYAEYQEEHKNTFPKSYQGCVAIFCNPFTFSQKAIWEKFLEENNVWASFGCHPHNAKDYNDDIEKSLLAALEHSKVRALGEIGLDYSNRNSCMKVTQFEVFRRQLKIVLKKQLPVVIHCREANEDAIRIIKEVLPIDYTIHLHCFTDTWEWAQKWLNEFPNLCIGITNVVTFPSAESVHEVARNIPLDRLLLETDAPYFIPKRGCQGMRWSHPGLAIHVAAQIAALKDIPIEQVFQATRNNTKRIYNI